MSSRVPITNRRGYRVAPCRDGDTLWVGADDDDILFKAEVTGAMRTCCE